MTWMIVWHFSTIWSIFSSNWNLQSYWTTAMSWKLTVVLDYCNVIETYSRIGLLQCHGNLQSYWTTEMSWKLTVVLHYCNVMGTYSRIGLLECHWNLQSYWTTELPVNWRSDFEHGLTDLQGPDPRPVCLSDWPETHSRIVILKCHGNLQSYCNTEMSWKLTVVLDYWNVMETYSRIGLLKWHGNLQSYWTTELPVNLRLDFEHDLIDLPGPDPRPVW